MRALCFLMILSFLTLCETGWRRTPLPAWPMSNHTRANRTRLFTNFTAARLAPLVEIIASSLDRLEAAIDSLHETTEIHMHNQRRAVLRARQLLWDNDDDWPAPDKDWPVPAPTPPFNSEGLPYPLDENGYYDSAPDDELPCISCGH